MPRSVPRASRGETNGGGEAQAAAVADARPRDDRELRSPPDRDARDRGRPHRVADEPPALLDHAEAGPEARARHGAEAADRIGRAHRIARRPAAIGQEHRGFRHLAEEPAVLVEAVRGRPRVVARGPPGEPNRAAGVVADTEALR